MNFKKIISLLFVLLSATSVAFAANNTRNVYSVYSDNFNGAHFYGENDNIPSSDEDGMKEYHWNRKISVSEQTSGVVEGVKYSRYTIPSNLTDWDVLAYTPITEVSTLAPKDMSAYVNGSIKFLARSSYSSFKSAYVGFQCRRTNGDILVYKTLDSLNFDNNGTWQDITIPLDGTFYIKVGQSSPTTGNIDSSYLQNVIALFIFQPTTLTANDYLDIDNIRWVQSGGTAGISFVTKNVSDDQETTGSISFAEDTFGQGWSVASQYVELDIDGELSSNNWDIRVYSNNTSTTTAGLYNETIDDVLPMAWKISCSTLPYTYTDDQNRENINTLEIGVNWQKDPQGKDYIAGLYDAGKVAKVGEDAKWWYPWFFMKTMGDSSEQSIVEKNEGCHTFENTDAGGVTAQYYDALTNFRDRKPKLFLACDMTKAKAVKYTGSLVINLSYE